MPFCGVCNGAGCDFCDPDGKWAGLRNASPNMRAVYGTLHQRITEQRHWIIEHGGNLDGYIRYYGSINDPMHSGDGGEAIYAADMRKLEELLSQQPITRIEVTVSESRDGTGAADHDTPYAFDRPTVYLNTRERARALIVRSRLDDTVLDAAVLNDAQLKLVDRHVLANREVYN